MKMMFFKLIQQVFTARGMARSMDHCIELIRDFSREVKGRAGRRSENFPCGFNLKIVNSEILKFDIC